MNCKKLLKDIKKKSSISYFKENPDEKDAIAYCSSSIHRGNMTLSMVKEHGCLQKNCPYFKKKEHRFWKDRQKRNVEKKIKKAIFFEDNEKIAEIIANLFFREE